MKKMTQTEWVFENKHALRELYADFLEETYESEAAFDEAFAKGEAITYQDFQTFLYKETHHGKK